MALVVGAIGALGAAMYVDGKYAVRKDIDDIRKVRKMGKLWEQAVKTNRMSLYYLFEKAVQERPSGECIWSREGCFTWKQALDRANAYGQWFLLQGVKPHDYVAFYLNNSADFVFAWLGLWSIGAAPAMINYNLAGKALLHCLKLSGSTLLLVDAEVTFRQRIDEVRSEIKDDLKMEICVMDKETMQEVDSQAPKRPEDAYREGVRGDWPMAMFYTSGTTGLPKGVPFNVDRGFMSGAARSARVGASPLRDDDRWYDCMPLYHGTGGVTAVAMMMQGITLCIGKKFSVSRFWKECHDSRATWITYVGETARYLLAAPPGPFDKDHNIRVMYGNGLRPDVWYKFRDRFAVPEVVEFFNSSEGVFGLVNYSKGDFMATSVGQQGALMRYITRNAYNAVQFDEDTGAIRRDHKTGFAIREPLEKGGEIIVQVPNEKAFAGYFNNPGATQKKFERSVFQKGDIWYRTGDSLRRDTDGRWFFLDRLGDTFRWKGENVSTAEVAEVLGRYPGVVEANVYGVLLPSHDGRAGCAAVYIDPSMKQNFDFAGLLKHCRVHLPKYAVPLFLRVVKEMTPMHNNKQSKVPLREEGVDPIKATERIMWISEKGKGETYIDFHPNHWEDLKIGRAQL